MLKQLYCIPEVKVYFDLHLQRKSESIDIPLSDQEESLLRQYLTLDVEGFVISDMNHELTNFIIQNVNGKIDIFFEYKLESDIYSVYRDKSGLKHRYNHVDSINTKLLDDLHSKGIKVVFKPAFRMAEILKYGSEYFDAVFISTGEAEMLSMHEQYRNIHYENEILNSYSVAGFHYVFLPFSFIHDRFQWTIGVPASSAVLEEIVRQINTGEFYLKTNSSGKTISLEPLSCPQIVYCPGDICPHSKISVLKLVSALHNLQITSNVCINACRERCIQREDCIQMIGTIGGLYVHSSIKADESDAEKINNMLAEERTLPNKKTRGTIL